MRKLTIAPVVGLILVIICWYAASKTLRTAALPGPVQVFQAAAHLVVNGELLQNTLISLERVAIGFCLGAALGIIAGLAAGLSWLARRTFYVLFEILRPIPAIAWLPLALLWFGFGNGSKYFVIAIGVFFPVFVAAFRGVQRTDPLHVRSAQALGANRLQVIRDVVLPSALPEILTAQRVSLSLAFIYLVAAEIIGGQSGLGYMIAHAKTLGLADEIYVGILLIGCLNLALGALHQVLERHLLRWHYGLQHEEKEPLRLQQARSKPDSAIAITR